MDFENYIKPTSRRDFLRQASCAAVGSFAVTNTIRDLRLINAALAQSVPSDYKALVCVFLGGGNDANNWIVPTQNADYAPYAQIRGNLALPQSSLLSLRTGPNASDPAYMDADGHTYGFHPTCIEMQQLFGEGKLVPVLNTGSLVRPITRAEYMANVTGTRPPQLFSHSDQVTQWQTSIPDRPPISGWGGRCADLLNDTVNLGGQISMSVSLAGTNTFEVGQLINQYHVSTTGAASLTGLTGNRLQAVKDLLALNHVNLQRTAYADVTERAIATGALLNSAIQSTALATDNPAGTWVWNTPFPNTNLGNQLKMIARLIEAGPRSASASPYPGFNMKRQVFFCSVGGYDTHTNQVTLAPTLNTTTGAHTNLLNEVSEALYAFQRAMEQISLSDKVTSFTASDFGRTFPTNSQGSDHGWGSHCMVMGGAVNGRRTYGKIPTFAINGPDDTGVGRWIPTTAVDQHAATLARWFGVSEGDLPTIFPNIGRFPTSNLGFMLA
jgi:uncharacterized protein (DUF1501 family)